MVKGRDMIGIVFDLVGKKNLISFPFAEYIIYFPRLNYPKINWFSIYLSKVELNINGV